MLLLPKLSPPQLIPTRTRMDGVAPTSNSIPMAVLAGIIIASLVGFISVVIIVVFVIQQIRRRHPKQLARTSQAASLVLPIQKPDLEAGIQMYSSSEKVNQDLQRSDTDFTIRSSEASFGIDHRDDFEASPQVPPMSSWMPNLTVPIPQEQHPSPAFASSTGSSTRNSDILDSYSNRQPGDANIVAGSVSFDASCHSRGLPS